MTLALPLNFCHLILRQEIPLETPTVYPATLQTRTHVARLDITFSKPLFMVQGFHLTSERLHHDVTDYSSLQKARAPSCLRSRTLDVRFTWLTTTSLFTQSFKNVVTLCSLHHQPSQIDTHRIQRRHIKRAGSRSGPHLWNNLTAKPCFITNRLHTTC